MSLPPSSSPTRRCHAQTAARKLPNVAAQQLLRDTVVYPDMRLTAAAALQSPFFAEVLLALPARAERCTRRSPFVQIRTRPTLPSLKECEGVVVQRDEPKRKAEGSSCRRNPTKARADETKAAAPWWCNQGEACKIAMQSPA